MGDTVIEVEEGMVIICLFQTGDVGHTPEWLKACVAIFLSDRKGPFNDGVWDKTAQARHRGLWSPASV